MIDCRTGKETTTEEAVKWILPKILHPEWERLQHEWDDSDKLKKFREDLLGDICTLRKYSGEKLFIMKRIGEQLGRLRLMEDAVKLRIQILEL